MGAPGDGRSTTLTATVHDTNAVRPDPSAQHQLLLLGAAHTASSSSHSSALALPQHPNLELRESLALLFVTYTFAKRPPSSGPALAASFPPSGTAPFLLGPGVTRRLARSYQHCGCPFLPEDESQSCRGGRCREGATLPPPLSSAPPCRLFFLFL